MESKNKYLSELADLASPYFKKNFQSHKLLQPTPSKFTANSLSDIFPESNPRFIAKIKKPYKLETRPTTANQNSAAILQVEKIGRLKILSHSEKFKQIQKFISSLKYLNKLSDDLRLNFLQVSSESTNHLEDSIVPTVTLNRLCRDSLINECQRLTTELRTLLSPNNLSKNLEALWRGMIKLLDYSFVLSDSACASIKKDSEELMDFRVSETQHQYDNLSQSSTYKIQTLTEEIEKLQSRILNLEQEISFKSKIISDKDKKMDEMNTFDNKEFTMFKLGRMVKGLNDFIEETEKEHEFQEKMFGGISNIFEIGEKLTKAPEVRDQETQTLSNSNNFRLGFRETMCPAVILNPFPAFLQEQSIEAMLNKDLVFEFCLEVFRSESIISFQHCFISKSIEKGFSGSDLLVFLRIIQEYADKAESWAIVFKRLLGIEGYCLGDVWNFLKSVDCDLKTTTNLFVSLDSVYSFLLKGFEGKSYKVHRVLYEIKIFEFDEEKKSFVGSKLREVEISLMKILIEVKNSNLNLKKVLSNPAAPGTVSKGFFVKFSLSLPLYLAERSVLDLWAFLTGSYTIEDYKISAFLTNMKQDHYLNLFKSQFLQKFDLLQKCMFEWEKRQEKFLTLIHFSSDPFLSPKDVTTYFKVHNFELSAEVSMEIFLATHCSLHDYTMNTLTLVDLCQKKKRPKSPQKPKK